MADRVAIVQAAAALRDLGFEEVPTYQQIWKAVADGRVSAVAKFSNGRRTVDLAELAKFFRLTRSTAEAA
jgi:hypothetical protein